MKLLLILLVCIIESSLVLSMSSGIEDIPKEGSSSINENYKSIFGIQSPMSWDPDNSINIPHRYSYSCQDNKCVRQLRSKDPFYQSFEACSLICGQYGSIWPAPTKESQIYQELVIFHPNYVKITYIEVSEKIVLDMLDEAVHYFLRKLHFKHPHYPQCYKGPFTEFEFKAIYGINHPNNKKSSHSSKDNSGSEKKKSRRKRTSKPHKNTNEKTIYNSESDRSRWQYNKVSPFNSKVEENHGRWMPNNNVDIQIEISSGEYELKLDTDESYKIVIETSDDTTTVKISAKTYYGARHALETLNQLIGFCSENNALFIVKQAKISDDPAFRYRGIMLDTGNNYFGKEEILSLLDAMSSNKLNSFHWHMADTASFPLITTRSPKLPMYGAYTPHKTYSTMDVWEIVKYANQRGIRVVPEFSAPGHAGSGWKWDNDDNEKGEKMVLCYDEEQPWFNYCDEQPCGQFNPVNQEVFHHLESIYMDMIQYFDPELFHMGGDGVSFKCWKHSEEVKKHIKDAGKEADDNEMMELWKSFQVQALSKLTEAYGKYRQNSVSPIYFSSPFSQNHLDSKQYIIQITNTHNDSEIVNYLKSGYRVIFSNYDVWNFGGSAQSWINMENKNNNSHSTSWINVYANSPLDILVEQGMENARSEESHSVLGGEGTVWSYETDDANLQSTLWPRASALAERLWSDPKTDAVEAQHRLGVHRQRMVQEGIRAEVFGPEYCLRNQGKCQAKEKHEKSRASDEKSENEKSSSKTKTESKADGNDDEKKEN